MPVFLRRFYMDEMLSTMKKEAKAMEDSSKKGNTIIPSTFRR